MSNSMVLIKFELLFDIFRYTHYMEFCKYRLQFQMGLEEHHLGIKIRFRIVQITYGIRERLKLKAYLSGTRTNYFQQLNK